MTQQTTFNPKDPPPLDQKEQELFFALQVRLGLEQLKAEQEGRDFDNTFTADTLRLLDFDKILPRDSKGRVNTGTFLLKLQHYGHAERTGKSRCSVFKSNHGHREQVWKMRKQL